MTLGIKDSLTIAKRTGNLSDSSNDQDDSAQGNETNLQESDDLMMVDDDDDDDIDSAWKEFYSSWKEVMKVDKVIKDKPPSSSSSSSSQHRGSTRRSGVRRGQTGTVPGEMIVIPTKCYDGPSLSPTTACNGFVQKQSTPREA